MDGTHYQLPGSGGARLPLLMSRLPFRIGSSLSVETRAGTLASQRRMELLAGIGSHRSIAAAAREVGITYKAAWDAVETMNNLAGAPLVERSVGGRGGGGAVLTPRGRQLVSAFQAANRKNQKFLDTLNGSSNAKAADDAQLLARLAFATSARNQLAGRVKRIEKGAVNDLVVLELPGGKSVTAVITRGSALDLGLKRGTAAVALIKASSIILAAASGASLRLSARNQLQGRITRVVRGAVNTEVVLEIPGGATLAAIVTNAAAKELKLARDVTATAIFKASSVILAVAG